MPTLELSQTHGRLWVVRDVPRNFFPLDDRPFAD
jgi:hypothetical protein